MRRAFAFVLPLVMPSLSFAQSCSFSTSNMNFSAVNTLSGAGATSTAVINVNCTGTPLRRVLLCPNLAAGSAGASSSAARQMLSGSSALNYQLYSDSARSMTWGSYSWAYADRSPAYAITLGLFGTGSEAITVYGSVLPNQPAAEVGTYISTFSGTQTPFRYRYNNGSNCDSATGTVATTSFAVNAGVVANCLIAVQNIDFGTRGVLNTNVDASGSVTATCTPGTTYSISLNGGTANSAPTARKMSKGSETVTYGLYKDANRSQPWGDATTSGSTIPGTGNGAAQVLPVYGRVPPQKTPSPGTYTDTVVVTLTY
ncbi:Csu type fimbrial protein [Ensifer sp. SL37]|uniref:Csu type fimbrial protein n=1 Tax=Ensifer sp. SL37 TaxID=2995137 RepID=UPI002276F2F0|nr:spore coat protein U domain-containing protein [Ensifer sp. SL37]MCY1740878.1 spore coat protein U domain-containing protein [Ensifer sp. SL37]